MTGTRRSDDWQKTARSGQFPQFAGEHPMRVVTQMGDVDWTMAARDTGRWMPAAEKRQAQTQKQRFSDGSVLTRTSVK